MSSVIEPEVQVRPTAADVIALIERLGDIDPRRVLLDPLPGTATEADLLRLLDHEDRICELIEGTLVEKVMGFQESGLAMWIGHLLYQFLDTSPLGELTGPDGTLRLAPDLVRIPDVAFFRREKIPGGRIGRTAIPSLVPDLAIEVLSEGNTRREMERKVRDYFFAGCTLVWLVDPVRRVVRVFTAPDVEVVMTESETLEGGTVLPGLSLPVARIFERLPAPEPTPPARPGRKKKRAG